MQAKNAACCLIAALFVCLIFSDVMALTICGETHEKAVTGVETIPVGSGNHVQNCPHHKTGICPLKHSAAFTGSGARVCHISKCAPLSSEKEAGFFIRKDVTLRQITDVTYREADIYNTPYRWRAGTGRESIEPRPPSA